MERLTLHVADNVSRLICRVKDGFCVGKPYSCPDVTNGCPEIKKALNKLAAYEDAEEQGRLVVLPCKVGDTLWYVTGIDYHEIEELPVLQILVDENGLFVFACNDWGGGNFSPEDFGKTVFLTREEAEKALEGMG